VSKTQNKENVTTIQIDKATRDELKKLGMKGETYDEIIKKLMERAKKQ
jgi:hypothetical protein